MKAISLFSSSGIGELGVRQAGIKTIIANELISERARLFKQNFPDVDMIVGDIWEVKDLIVEETRNKLKGEELFLINATPPCQGMSLAGMGKMLNDFRSGKTTELNPKFDERNRLIIPTIEIINRLQPKWIIIENVENMKNTLIYDETGKLITIPEYIFSHLDGYVGRMETIDVADYGVPQNRKRLITILTKDISAKDFFIRNQTFLPPRTHSSNSKELKPWVTVRDAIGSFPKLDAKKKRNSNVEFNELHFVPLLDEKKYHWIENTPEGKSAFDNQCINEKCLFNENRCHGSRKDSDSGIVKSIGDTPLFCEKCGEMLPRPYVADEKGYRLMKGYISAYKRMWWDRPASTLTTRFQFVSSDNNVHPEQNRVLSLYEGTVLQTISKYKYSWKIEDEKANLGLIRDSIGESIPPLILELIAKYIINL